MNQLDERIKDAAPELLDAILGLLDATEVYYQDNEIRIVCEDRADALERIANAKRAVQKAGLICR